MADERIVIHDQDLRHRQTPQARVVLALDAIVLLPLYFRLFGEPSFADKPVIGHLPDFPCYCAHRRGRTMFQDCRTLEFSLQVSRCSPTCLRRSGAMTTEAENSARRSVFVLLWRLSAGLAGEFAQQNKFCTGRAA